jgi:iron complex outermembrane receptor protein
MKRRKMIRTARGFGLGAAALLSGCLVSAQASAQSQSKGHSGQSARASLKRELDDTQIETVVVTAEKRAEKLQNVPIAIAAFKGHTLRHAGVTAVRDLDLLSPSLQYGTRSGNIFIAIRGIGQEGQDIGSQPGVVVALDGVPLLNNFMMDPTFLDVQRVEVLRGPQGTFEGMNALGGAINIYSNPPTDKYEGGLSATMGNYSRFGLKGYVNIPLIAHRLFARIAFQTDRANGWLKNAYLGTRNNNTDLTEVRGSLLAKVTHKFTVRAIIEDTRDRSNPAFSILIGRARPDIPTLAEALGLPQNNLQDLTVYFNTRNLRSVSDFRSTVIANWQATPNLDIVSTTGYIQDNIRMRNLDVDLTTLNLYSFPFIGIYSREITQELTANANFGSRAQLTAGAFYMHGNSSEPLYLATATDNSAFVYHPNESLNSYALYAQFRYDLTRTLRATVGGRYTIVDKSFYMGADILGTPFINHAKASWSSFTPRFVLDYKPRKNVMVYASVSKGFKAGGFNTLGDVSQPVNTFNPEYVWNYETGTKSEFFNKRLSLDLDGFYDNYTNVQQTVFRTNLQTGVRYPEVDNVASATIKGIELSYEAIPYAGLTVSGSVTRLFATYGQFYSIDPIYPELGNQNLSGRRVTQAPKWQFAMAGAYNFLVSDNVMMTLRADYKWQSKVYFDIYNDALDTRGAYGLLNGSVSIATVDADWTLTAWIHNAFDKRYVSDMNMSPSANPARAGSLGLPRMYGLTLHYHF